MENNLERIHELVSRIEEANKHYYNGSAIISDEEYDALKDELQDLSPTHPLLLTVGHSIQGSAWQDRKHNIPMGSLIKVNDIVGLVKWSQRLDLADAHFAVQEKLDGISVSLDYEEGCLVAGITRGDGIVGEDITPNVLKMQGVIKHIPIEHPVSIRGEIILFKQDWENHFSHMANPRNAASGLARRQNDAGQEHLRILCYDIVGLDFKEESEKLKLLSQLGFATPNYYSNVSVDSDSDHAVSWIYREYEDKLRQELQYEIDGLVIKLEDVEKQKKLGLVGDREYANPRAQIALKFSHEMRETIARKIDWQVGKTGRLTPVAHVDPVKIAGVMVSKASLHNIENIQRLKVSEGATVLVSRRNDVIPYVEKVIEPGANKVIAPASCPICCYGLEFDGTYLYCPNSECPAHLTGDIHKWINNLGIEEFGPKLISAVCEKGWVEKVPDLYHLTVEQLASLDRMGATSAKKVIRNIHARKELPLHVLLGSLNIPGCGQRVFEKLCKNNLDSLDKIRASTEEDLQEIPGIGPSLAKDIVQGIRYRSDIIDELCSLIKIITSRSDGPLLGKSFCFTGSMKKPRKELQQMVVDAGGEVKTSVSAGLSYLVTAENNSSKSQKAQKLGVVLISEEEFYGLLT